MKYLLYILITIVSVSNTMAQTVSFGGHISSNTTWSADTVKIISDVIIDNQNTLTINAGTYIEFQGHYMIHVQGTILANGTENDTITFTHNDTTGFNNEFDVTGSWFGFKFINTDITNDSSLLSYCKIEYIKDLPEQDSIKPGGAIVIVNYSKLNIENSLIQNNKAENDYTYIGNGGAITMFENSNPIIINNTFKNNYATANGGAIYCNKSNPKIINNIFDNNYAGYENIGSGGAIFLSFCDGIYTHDTIISEITNNLIINNTAYEGGGIYSSNSSAYFLNNTICNNNAHYGGGLHTKKAHPVFYNTIIFFNNAIEGSQVYVNHDASICTPGNNPYFYYSNLQGGEDSIKVEDDENYGGRYENNLDTLPIFSDISENNFTLHNTSPLLNKGKGDSLEINIEIPVYDLAGNSRVFNDTIDIGAYENQYLTSIHSKNKNTELLIYPNPTTNIITIKAENILQVEVINTLGKTIVVKKANANQLSISLIDNKKGIYFVKTTTKTAIFTKTIILE